MSGSYNNNRIDTINEEFIAAEKTVGTTQLLVCVGADNLPNRQSVVIYNRSTNTVWVGPTGVTTSSKGVPIPSQAMVTFNVGDEIYMYLIADTAGNAVTVQEFA